MHLHLIRLHQLWITYISNVTDGRFTPLDGHLYNKELDYACSLYYFVCGANGEDIIYWSKFYGVFPTNVPDSVMSWSKGTPIFDPEVSINYQYSFQRPFEVDVLNEFNMCSSGTYEFANTYNPDILGTGNTWVGAPFVETVKKNGRTIYKLRFRPQ